jgi:hypothetical protein
MKTKEINEKIAIDVMGFKDDWYYEQKCNWNPMESPEDTLRVIEKLRLTKPFVVTFSPSGYSIGEFGSSGHAGFATLGEAVCMFALGEI